MGLGRITTFRASARLMAPLHRHRWRPLSLWSAFVVCFMTRRGLIPPSSRRAGGPAHARLVRCGHPPSVAGRALLFPTGRTIRLRSWMTRRGVELVGFADEVLADPDRPPAWVGDWTFPAEQQGGAGHAAMEPRSCGRLTYNPNLKPTKLCVQIPLTLFRTCKLRGCSASSCAT